MGKTLEYYRDLDMEEAYKKGELTGAFATDMIRTVYWSGGMHFKETLSIAKTMLTGFPISDLDLILLVIEILENKKCLAGYVGECFPVPDVGPYRKFPDTELKEAIIAKIEKKKSAGKLEITAEDIQKYSNANLKDMLEEGTLSGEFFTGYLRTCFWTKMMSYPDAIGMIMTLIGDPSMTRDELFAAAEMVLTGEKRIAGPQDQYYLEDDDGPTRELTFMDMM